MYNYRVDFLGMDCYLLSSCMLNALSRELFVISYMRSAKRVDKTALFLP